MTAAVVSGKPGSREPELLERRRERAVHGCVLASVRVGGPVTETGAPDVAGRRAARRVHGSTG